MGTDIHAEIEIKVNGKWRWLSQATEYVNPELPDPSDFNRSYNLFAILCGVRNGTGFAGIKTGEGFNPISDPKGLPDDLSPELRARLDEGFWVFGDHSQSYVTEAELDAYDWRQETTQQGVVSVEEFKTFKAKGHPENWCGDIMGFGIEIVKNEEMERRIAANDFATGKRYFTLVRWTRKYSEAVNPADYELLTDIRQVIAPDKRDEVEDIRLVFGFDS